MITLQLTGHREKLADHNDWNLKHPPLYHQARTAEALLNPQIDLVMNSYDTGTGKTLASKLHLFALNQEAEPQDVLFVAPTNALLAQHETDLREFVAEHQLNFYVKRITAAENRKLRQQLVDRGDYKTMRPGETLYRLIANYREFAPQEKKRKGLILVVNPDIFYYAMMLQYAHHDQRNLFAQFLTSFRYIVIDEFHYYDQKQLSFFLFFFAICQELGYFAHAGRKICLLSATPNSAVQTYLDRLFGDRWALISPNNEPASSQQLETIETLAPLSIRFSNGQLTDYTSQLTAWLGQGLDGVVISDSLQRVNELHSMLKPALGETVHRITGPETEVARQQATSAPLILATPTVDIGYNFVKLGKARQNIDFLLCESRFRDDLRQRIGRAGRILGKREQDQTSHAVVLLNETVLTELQPYDGQTLTRVEFSQLLNTISELPQKHNLFRYISSHAITELFYPIYQVHRLSLPDDQVHLESLYTSLCDLFGAARHASFYRLSAYFRNHYKQKMWLDRTKEDQPVLHDLMTAEQVSHWLVFMSGGQNKYEASDLLPYLARSNVLGTDVVRERALRYFVDSQWQLTRSLFTFRDSFQPATAVFSDPHQLFSSEKINQYNIIHILSNYDVQWYDNQAQFIEQWGKTALRGDFYGRLLQYRQPKLQFELKFDARDHLQEADKPSFEAQWTRRPVALRGLELRAKERRGDLIQLNQHIAETISDQFVPLFLLPHESDFPFVSRAYRRLRYSTIYGYDLHVLFEDGSQAKYLAYLGKEAWLAHAELLSDIRIAEKLLSTAIIC